MPIGLSPKEVAGREKAMVVMRQHFEKNLWALLVIDTVITL